MNKILFICLFLLFSLMSFAQIQNFNSTTPFLDGSAALVQSGNPLKIKFDERYKEYTLNASDVLVYESPDNPISGFVTSVSNQLTYGSTTIKRGVNMVEINLLNDPARKNKYYVIEIKDSKGESSYLRFYYY